MHADCLLIVQTRSGFLTVFYRIAIEISVYQNESCVNDSFIFMPEHFCPERLIQVRESLHINKAEAARRLNLSAMAYGRYERGEREPSYQYAFYIAYTFHCNLDFLYGQSDEMETDFITITRSDSEEVYSLVEEMQNNSDFEKRILAYAEKLRAL